jgi:DNA-binding response OmpR family regulator
MLLKKIVIAEDDDAIAHMVSMSLGDAGFLCLRARDGEEALKLVKAHDPDVLVLDVMMPRVDGFRVCEWVRERDSTTPVIFLTAKSIEKDKVNGFHIGCDDYITKPFSGRELLARVSAVLRRAKSPNETEKGDAPFAFCSGTIIPEERLYADAAGRATEISESELRIIRMLAERENHVVKKSALMFMLWGAHAAQSRTVDTHISNLRKKIDPCARHIRTIYGMGYKYVC